jgi:TRAP-type C4-dicarboxylate transport system substrate-binding protein
MSLALSPLQVFAQGAPVVLKFGSFVSPKSITNSVSVPAFIKDVEAASEGTLKIEHYPGGIDRSRAVDGDVNFWTG